MTDGEAVIQTFLYVEIIHNGNEMAKENIGRNRRYLCFLSQEWILHRR